MCVALTPGMEEKKLSRSRSKKNCEGKKKGAGYDCGMKHEKRNKAKVAERETPKITYPKCIYIYMYVYKLNYWLSVS